MKTRTKIASVLSIGLLGGILLLAGSLLGMENERAKIKNQEQEEVVTEVAIVNLDEGMERNGSKIYYSVELLDMSSEYFIAENLEAAREGILNGSYAAYILIPAEFSRNTESINSVPQKAILEYAMNPNLREDVSRLTMMNIKNFEISLNTNMSYMYLQALLEEFHHVQDMSGIILANDTKEMQRILSMDANALLETPEYLEVELTEVELEEIDFEETFGKNEQVMSEFDNDYRGMVEEIEKAFGEIEKEKMNVIAEKESLYSLMEDIDIEKDEKGDYVYQDGMEAMREYMTDYAYQEKRIAAILDVILEHTEDKTEEENEDMNTSEDVIGDIRSQLMPLSQNIEENVQNSVNRVNEKINSYNKDAEAYIQSMEAIMEKVQSSVTEKADAQTEEKVVVNPENLTQSLEEMEEALANYPQMKTIELETVYDTPIERETFTILESEIDKVPKADVAAYKEVFDKKLLAALREEIASEKENIQNGVETVTLEVEAYTELLMKLDLLSFYDYENMDNLLVELHENISQLEEQIVKTHGKYEEYVADTVDAANESMLILQDNLDTAYENTSENVKIEVQLAKEARERINEKNTDILGSFRAKLPYTRIGGLEYVQAYDFMAKPIILSDASVQKDRTVIWQDYDSLKNILLGMILLWGVTMYILLYDRAKGIVLENDENL